MSYKLTTTGPIFRESDGVWIPPDPDNLDYQEFQKWTAKGNVPAEADPEPEKVEPTFEQKLESIGLTVADIKAALTK